MIKLRICCALLLLAGCAANQPASPPPAAPPADSVAAASPAPRPTATPEPATATATPKPTATPTATATPEPPTATPTPEPTATPEPPTATPTPEPAGVTVGGIVYDAYIDAAVKEQQAYQYSCEFDAAWVVFETYGIPVGVDELIARMPHDTSIEPYYVETAGGFEIYGGDIAGAYSGDYAHNFLARSTGGAMRQVFAAYGLEARPVSDRAGVEAALRRGELVWMKTTVDFKDWRAADWIMPDGRRHATVLGNDHAVVVIGFNGDGVVIRDVLGPTSSNVERPYEYRVSWERFLEVWAAQSFDGLAVGRP
ncbi:MAG TPA: hypothetical protein VGE07_14280 [Herpetosiphonaceae bacterium]